MNESWTLRAGDAAAEILARGGELVSLRMSGVGVLHRDGDRARPDAGWANHATVLFPWIGRLRGGRSETEDGREIRGPRNHGLARDADFELREHGEDFVRIGMRSSPEMRRSFPFAFDLELRYELRSDGLNLEMTARNPSGEPLRVGLGWHPGFAVDRGKARVSFPAGGSASRVWNDDAGLLTGTESPVDLTNATFSDAELARAVILALPSEGRTVHLDTGLGHRIEVRGEDFPLVGLWAPIGEPFVCVEPWHGADDPAAGCLWEEKRDLLDIPPGGERTLRAEVRITGIGGHGVAVNSQP